MAKNDNDIMAAQTVRLPVMKSFRVVAVAGTVGDWAAYSVSADAEWPDAKIRAEGHKISAEEARGIFPQFADMPYRL